MTRRTSLLLLALFSCGAGCNEKDLPEEPVWRKQACAHCAMIVGDKRYAAQLLSEDGVRSHFDDLGCMVSFVEERHVRVRRAWVRAEAENVWLDAESARYRTGAHTPMDYGFSAGRDGDLTLGAVRRAVAARKEGRS